MDDEGGGRESGLMCRNPTRADFVSCWRKDSNEGSLTEVALA